MVKKLSVLLLTALLANTISASEASPENPKINRIVFSLDVAPGENYNQDAWNTMTEKAITCMQECQKENNPNWFATFLNTMQDIFTMNDAEYGINGNVSLFIGCEEDADEVDTNIDVEEVDADDSDEAPAITEDDAADAQDTVETTDEVA